MSIFHFITKNSRQTKLAGRLLAKEILNTKNTKKQDSALIIALQGDLGSGKTTFAQGLAAGLAVKEKITSPTFVIMKKFEIRNTKSETNPKFKTKNSKHKFKYFYHIDCYRIRKPKEILELGFKEIITDPKNIIAIEWPERIKSILPKNTLWLKFELKGMQKRKIVLR